MTINITKDKCLAIFLLHALGDTIGFKNGIWEFNYGNNNFSDMRNTVEIVSEFISLGGITGISLKDWNISDDTILNYVIGKFILDLGNHVILNDKNINILKKNIIDYIILDNKKNIERGYGTTTIKSIKKWEDNIDIDERTEPFQYFSGGNGCAMRTLSIGLRFYNDKDLDNLIEYSIQTSKITHNSPIGFLGGFCTAYFIKLAVNNIPLVNWVYDLIDILQSDKIKKYINIDDDDVYFAYRTSIKIWKIYLDYFFSDEKKPLNLKTSINLMSRFRLFDELERVISDENIKIIGGNGQTAVIMAYNALLDCDGNWEKLVYYAMLHGGDSDTVGSIAGGLYGAVYGYDKVPENMLKYIEMKKELIELGEKYFDFIHK